MKMKSAQIDITITMKIVLWVLFFMIIAGIIVYFLIKPKF